MTVIDASPAHVRISLGNYAHTAPLKSGAVRSPHIALDFTELDPAHLAFKPMVREQKFDVSEMAIVTYLQAKSFGKPMVLLPAVMLGRFQHHCMLYDSTRGTVGPADLPGRRVGVRAYTQTTGAWLRGILADDYGIPSSSVQWVTFEDAHVAEYRDPPGVERAAPGKKLEAMLYAGEIDAAIFGAEVPDDPRLKSVIADPDAAAQAWHRKHGVVPINHMVVVSQALSQTRPDVVREVYDLLVRAKRAAAPSLPAGVDFWPLGVEACRPALAMIIDYALEQRLIPRRFSVDELFDDVTGAFR
jgi:4,5-dihydroxyphthalate decarboxylase